MQITDLELEFDSFLGEHFLCLLFEGIESWIAIETYQLHGFRFALKPL